MAAQNNSSSEFMITTLVPHCYFSKSGLYIFPAFTAVSGFLVFPLYFLVLHTGFQRWRKNKRSTVSHTDFFTYHNVFFELILFCGYCVISCAAHQFNKHLLMYGTHVLLFASPAILLSHVLTCIERYLAVVYPVVYLSLRKHQWICARNWLVCFIWVFCLSFTCVLEVLQHHSIPSFVLLGTVTSIVFCCSVQVLRSLRNPSPGEGRRVSKSKRKAFYTMLAILSTLMAWFISGIVYIGTERANLLEPDVLCKYHLATFWIELSSSLVLPLLFLYRAGKLPTFRGKKIENSG